MLKETSHPPFFQIQLGESLRRIELLEGVLPLL